MSDEDLMRKYREENKEELLKARGEFNRCFTGRAYNLAWGLECSPIFKRAMDSDLSNDPRIASCRVKHDNSMLIFMDELYRENAKLIRQEKSKKNFARLSVAFFAWQRETQFTKAHRRLFWSNEIVEM